MNIRAIKNSLVNIFYPLKCAGCRKAVDPSNEPGVCGICLTKIPHNPKPHCNKCGRPVRDGHNPCRECQKSDYSFSHAHSACLYDGVLKEIIHSFKYSRRLSLSRLLSKLMVDFIKDNPQVAAGIDIVTFVPMHKRRLRERGFNQSMALANTVSQELGLVVIDTLDKPLDTRRQNELSRNERLINLSGTFFVKDKAAVNSKRILLIDDIMTTGATLNECAKALLTAGAAEVRCLTLARGA